MENFLLSIMIIIVGIVILASIVWGLVVINYKIKESIKMAVKEFHKNKKKEQKKE